MEKCPACTTSRSHTEKFEKILTAISDELEKRDSMDDKKELAMALSVLVADSLEIDIYR